MSCVYLCMLFFIAGQKLRLRGSSESWRYLKKNLNINPSIHLGPTNLKVENKFYFMSDPSIIYTFYDFFFFFTSL